ncbi:MAG: AAA family ATPase [Candidatus Krumholzibacteriota bacterium]|nr:AAA family ATPase [Candidatus Krumholzibacteriota bacterium]
MAGTGERRRVIVIGDWFVDENWLVSRQNLYHSSHTGDVHYLAHLKDPKERIVNLGGAAEVLVLLKSYFERNNDRGEPRPSPFDFVGVGAWHPGDDDILRCILCDGSPRGDNILLTPYTVSCLKHPAETATGTICPHDGGKTCDSAYDFRNLAAGRTDVSTTRHIRCFEGFSGGDLHHLCRIDWHLDREDPLDYERGLAGLGPVEGDAGPAAIIIEDHGLGVISDACIEQLLLISGKETKWFVRTKIDDPPWMKTIRASGREIFLTVADHQLAAHKKGERRWWYGRQLGRAGLELLGNLTGELTWDDETPVHNDTVPIAQHAAVLLNDNTVFAKEGKEIVHTIDRSPGKRQEINIGRTTVFFSALVAQALDPGAARFGDFSNHCEHALSAAYAWSREISASWHQNENLQIFSKYAYALRDLDTPCSRISARREEYCTLWRWWKSSSKGLGRVELATDRWVLQCWRGEGALDDYVCVGGPKRDAINNLVSAVAAFEKDPDPSRPLGCLLIASSGWGKSFLAQRLARRFDMRYLEFSIAQMATAGDLVDCFARIASIQNRTEKRTLVFIDEINARIEGNDVMGLLLSPLWDGLAVTKGKSYRLDPGVWIFASTARMDELVDSNKGSDFASRLNGPIIELDFIDDNESLSRFMHDVRRSLINLVGKNIDTYRRAVYESDSYRLYMYSSEAKLKTELVYLLTALLMKKWGPITRIQECVLQLFHDLLPVNGARSLEFFASSFVGIRRGIVRAANVPALETNDALRRHVIVPEDWLDPAVRARLDQSTAFVEIEAIVK